MTWIGSPLPAGVLIFVRGHSSFSVASVQTLKLPFIPFFLSYPPSAQEIQALRKSHNLHAHHLSAPPLLPLWFTLAPAWVITLASYLASLIAYLQSVVQGSNRSFYSSQIPATDSHLTQI